jgi:N6-L-threonylcarbamoyladenine synthase
MNVQSPRPTTGPILGIETSCDETAAAVLGADGSVLANVAASQHAVHERFGGVVPELASRAHIEMIERVVLAAVGRSARVLGLTRRDRSHQVRLAGALIVGLNYAKSLAYMFGLPLVGVSHLEAHIASAWLKIQSFRCRPSCSWFRADIRTYIEGTPRESVTCWAARETMRLVKPSIKGRRC